MAYRAITKKGYVRILHNKRLWLEHRFVWESAHGTVPKGYQIHHKDGDKQNNELTNLLLIDPTTHKRLHSGCIKENGKWIKPCRKCGEKKRLDSYYLTQGKWPMPWCKVCQKANATRTKHLRKV